MLASVVLLSGCNLPFSPQLTVSRPSLQASVGGATLAQYFTLAAFRVADRLAAASNSLDQAFSDLAQGLISPAYLRIVAARSASSADAAENEALALQPPASLQIQAGTFLDAVRSLTSSLEDTAQALDRTTTDSNRQLAQDLAERQRAVAEVNAALTSLVDASWPGRQTTSSSWRIQGAGK